MKCTNSVKLFAYLLLFMFFCTSCASSGMPLPYQENVNVSHSGFLANLTLAKAEGFADDICIVSEDITENADVFDEESGAAGLFDVNKAKAIYARNVHEKMYPASLTKVMTALVALENGSLQKVNVHNPLGDVIESSYATGSLSGLKGSLYFIFVSLSSKM